MGSSVSTLERMGYAIGAAGDANGVRVWWVTGPGVHMYVRDDDTATWESLINSQAAAERQGQADGSIPPPVPNRS